MLPEARRSIACSCQSTHRTAELLQFINSGYSALNPASEYCNMLRDHFSSRFCRLRKKRRSARHVENTKSTRNNREKFSRSTILRARDTINAESYLHRWWYQWPSTWLRRRSIPPRPLPIPCREWIGGERWRIGEWSPQPAFVILLLDLLNTPHTGNRVRYIRVCHYVRRSCCS